MSFKLTEVAFIVKLILLASVRKSIFGTHDNGISPDDAFASFVITSSPSPSQTVSIHGKDFKIASPVGERTAYPPKAIMLSGARCFIKLAKESEAIV